MMHAELLALLLPPESYAPRGRALRAELCAEGAALDTSQKRADTVKGAITPLNAEQLLPDWERICGITPPAGGVYQQRLQAVLAKLAETGGLSIPYFIHLAAGVGFQITIDEPSPFRAGSSRAGQRLTGEEVIWVWRVNVRGSATRTYRFRAGVSRAGERLTYASEPVLETVLNDLKPAHTLVVFTYQE